MNNWSVVLASLVALLAVVLVGCQATRAGYESAPYSVVRSDGSFELRDYPSLTVVETSMTPDARGADGSFGRLFRYITGSNEQDRKIAMTTPVFMSSGDSNRSMAFVLPATLRSNDVPRPRDGQLAVRDQPAGRFAVHRFRGGRSTEREQASLDRLQEWMAAEGMRVLSPPVYGYFDPPWTPGFLRRNEVMLRTDGSPR